MKSKHFIILVLLVSTFACNGEDDACSNLLISTSNLESKYGCANTKYEMDLVLTEDYIIIRNQEDFNIQIAGSCQPDIDFSTFDLVIGKKQLPTGNISIDYELTENCKTGNYILKVVFNQNETTEAPDLTYHSLIPKLEEGQEITVLTVIN